MVGGDSGTEMGDAWVVKLPCVVAKAVTIVAGDTRYKYTEMSNLV